MTPDADTAIQARRPLVETAPAFCDLVWRRERPFLFTARRTPLYEGAVRRAGHNMAAAGFDMHAARVTLDLSACADLDALARRLEIWTRVAREDFAQTERRDAAMRPLSDDDVAPLQEALIELIAEAEWAFGKRLDRATEFAHAARLTRKQFDWAADILAGAEAAVESVDARLATPAGIEAMERAYDRDVREDLLEACRELTAMDGDRCREANGMGWGAVSSAAGHCLAGRDSLSVLEAAHALTLVFPHRRQLSPPLRERLFGPAPEPSPAP